MTDIDADFQKALKKPERESRFMRENAKLVPYIRKWLKARERDPSKVANPGEFYDNFLKPNGITVSKTRFYFILKDQFEEYQ